MKICKCKREILYNSDMGICHYCEMKKQNSMLKTTIKGILLFFSVLAILECLGWI